MAAYRVLSKKSSRAAYDADVFAPFGPHYAYQRRDRPPPSQDDYENWKEYMNNMNTRQGSAGLVFAYFDASLISSNESFDQSKRFFYFLWSSSYYRMHRDPYSNPYSQFNQNSYQYYNAYNSAGNRQWDQWTPDFVFNKKRILPFLICFVVSNIFIMYFVYS